MMGDYVDYDFSVPIELLVNADVPVEGEVRVVARLEKFYPAVLNKRPEDCYPAEGGTIEIIDTVFPQGSMFGLEDLTEENYTLLEGIAEDEAIKQEVSSRFDPRFRFD